MKLTIALVTFWSTLILTACGSSDTTYHPQEPPKSSPSETKFEFCSENAQTCEKMAKDLRDAMNAFDDFGYGDPDCSKEIVADYLKMTQASSLKARSDLEAVIKTKEGAGEPAAPEKLQLRTLTAQALAASREFRAKHPERIKCGFDAAFGLRSAIRSEKIDQSIKQMSEQVEQK